MPRHVSSHQKQETFKLPGIHLNNRVANPHADSRRANPSPEHRKAHSLPPPRQNGFLVKPENGPTNGLTYYAGGGSRKTDYPMAGRQRSLPSRRHGGVEKQRQANSAPSRKQRLAGQCPPLPKLNTLVARSRGPGGETSNILTTNFAGVSTRDQEAGHIKSNRFATNWAQVRAENHIDMCATNPDNTPSQTARGEGPKARDKASPDRTTGSRHGRSPEAEPAKGGKAGVKASGVHSPGGDKENRKPDTFKRNSPPPAPRKIWHPTKKKSRHEKEKQTIRFVTPEDEAQENGKDTADSGVQNVQPCQRTNRRKPAWDNRLALSVPLQSQTPIKSIRRYEAELTHMPSVTSSKQVYRAYTGRSKRQLRDGELNEDSDSATDGDRPSTKGSQREDGQKDDCEDPKKEHILTRNEVKMYIHLQNVYGSESYRQQRKEWFFKKLTDVQLQELKQQAADRRHKQKRKEESRKRQERQLMFVRRKFRKDQMRRFRTQYVTSRVLAYEREDRDLYGLPEEMYDDDDIQEQDVFNFDDLRENDIDDQYNPVIDEREASRSPLHPSADAAKHEQDWDHSQTVTYDGDVKDSPLPNASHDTQSTQNTDARKTPSLKPVNPIANNANNDTPKTGLHDDKPSNIAVETSTLVSEDSATATHSQNRANKGFNKTSSNKDINNTSGNKDFNKTGGSKNLDVISDSKESNKQDNVSMPLSELNKKEDTENQSVDTQPPEVSSKPSIQPQGTQYTTKDNDKKTDFTSKDQGLAVEAKSTEGKQISNQTNKDSPKTVEDANRLKQNAPQHLDDKPDTVDSRVKRKGQDVAVKAPSVSSKTPTTAITAASSTAQSKTNIVVPPEGQGQAQKETETDRQKERKQTERDSKNVTQRGQTQTQRGQTQRGQNNSKVQSVGKQTGDGVNQAAGDSFHLKDSDVIAAESSTPKPSVTKTFKERRFTSTKEFGVSYPSAPKQQPTGQPSVANASGSQTPGKKVSIAAKQTSQTGQVGRDSKGRTEADRQADYRARKRKSTLTQPKSEVAQKKQLERKYGKMFEVNTGPSWNPGAKPPKMEGIDTVFIKVTDDKGRTRLKKREVKDVLKEAKAQLAVPSPDSPRRRSTKGGQSSQQTDIIRPASADTLDFDDDEDEEEEDVFERVRRKYNLQIDSDEDDDDSLR